jgi:hypothetical protein
MNYEPSHRKPPSQERWPNATPGEGWAAYQQGDDGRAWEAAAAYAGSRNGYAAASNGQGDAWGGAQYSDPGQGYWPGESGYGGTTTAYPATGEGYAPGGYAADGYAAEGYAAGGYSGEGYGDGFDGAPVGYADSAADRYAGGYGETQGYYETPNEWDGYRQPGREFTSPASYPEPSYPEPGYPEQDEYPGASSVLVAPDTMGEWWRQDRSRDGDRAPGHRGPIVGVMMGVLAAAVGIGVATLAAAFVRPQASPVSAVRGVFIDRIPAALRHAAVAHLGTHGQTVLLIGAIGLIAMVLGLMARRNVSVGVAGIAVFGLLGAFVAITRPEGRASDVIPSAIGGLAGIMALLWLARASAPAPRVADLPPAYSGSRRRV